MGYNVSTIKNIPQLGGYYFFLVDKYYSQEMAQKLFSRKFDEVARGIGENSVIIKSFKSEKITDEILDAFRQTTYFRDVYNFIYYNSPGIIIMSRHPDEILKAFRRTTYLRDIYDFFYYNSPGIIIMSKHPLVFDCKKELLAIITFETLNKVYLSEEELIRDVIDLSMNNSTKIFDKCLKNDKSMGILKRIKNAIPTVCA